MSFSSMAKEELAHLDPASDCCALAELSALIRMDGALHIHRGELGLHTSSDNAAVARLLLKLAKQVFGLRTELAQSEVSRLDRRRRHVILIPPQRELPSALIDLGLVDQELSIVENVPADVVRSSCCISSYLRGAFLGGGSISEPRRGHHLEISTSNLGFADDLVALLDKVGIKAKINARPKDFAVYLKDADRIVSLLALMGAHKTLLEWENIHIVRMLKNEVNRIVNCETANLTKVAKAAVRQLKLIGELEEAVGLRTLSRSLREIAHARIRHPSLSLAELGETFDPPLSKVAVAHRVRRLSQLAQRLSVEV